MPGPGLGRGNAFAKGSGAISLEYVALSRKAQKQRAAEKLSIDSPRESEIIALTQRVVGAIDRDLAKRALGEVRKLLSDARKGVDPESSSLVRNCAVCCKTTGARLHIFMCRRRYEENHPLL